MRTTLTLDADVARMLKTVARTRKKPFKVVVNDALRTGLGISKKSTKQSRFVVVPHNGGFKPGVDPRQIGKLGDALEDKSTLAKLARR